MTLASVLQARTQAVQVPPQHVWEGMAQYTPEAAELACHSLDIASAESYFARVRVNSGGTLSPFKCACLDCVLPNVTPLQASAQGCNDRQRELNVSADMSMYILQSGAASRDAQQGAAQRTARLALTMAAAAAADSAAGTLHASTPQPTSQAAQGPLPLHTLAGLPTGPSSCPSWQLSSARCPARRCGACPGLVGQPGHASGYASQLWLSRSTAPLTSTQRPARLGSSFAESHSRATCPGSCRNAERIDVAAWHSAWPRQPGPEQLWHEQQRPHLGHRAAQHARAWHCAAPPVEWSSRGTWNLAQNATALRRQTI